MATISIEFGHKDAHRQRTVFFLIRQGKTRKRIKTQVSVSDSELSANRRNIKNVNKGRMIEKMRRELEDRLMEMSLEIQERGEEADAAFIVERLLSRRRGLDFFAFADEWVARGALKGTKNYASMLNCFAEYLGSRKITFDEITYRVLQGFEQHLSGRPRAQSLYLGGLRHLYREAMREYNTEHETIIKHDPFMRYKVPRQQMKKGVRALALEQLMKICEFKSSLPHSRAQLARDCFIMSFCLMGMNSVDMYAADAELHGDMLCYHRAKTTDRRSDGAYIEVRVHPMLEKLMEKYGDTSRVWNFHRRYCSGADFNRALNIGLKEVGAAVGVPGLQFYQARHTFATLSRNLMRFSKSDVDEALNHVGSMDIADIYIAKDFSIINDNNFKLLERVFEGGME